MAVTVEAVVPARLTGETVLVVDVLRASTTIVTALANGACAIEPGADPAEARRRLAAHEGNGVVLAGERRGNPVPGFHLGNSPLEMTAARVQGRTIVFTTSNGTRALLACRAAAAVGVAGLVNLTAAVRWATSSPRDVTVVCSGERGSRSLEDHVCAGLLVDGIARRVPGATLTEAAQAAVLAAGDYARDVRRLAEDSAWARHLRRSGRSGDVTACLTLDVSSLVPLFLADVDKVVAGHG